MNRIVLTFSAPETTWGKNHRATACCPDLSVRSRTSDPNPVCSA